MRNRFFNSLIICAVLALMPQLLSARNDAPVPTADSVAMLDNKVEALDNKVTTFQKILDKLPNISAFMQMFYTWEDTEPATSQFRVRRARITLSGNIYKNYLDYNFMVDFAGSVKLIDAYFRVTPWKQFNVQIGSFRPAFTLENVNYGATTMELIEYPQIVSKMTTIGDITGLGSGSAGRDIGIQAYGGFFNRRGFSTLQYYVGIYNGNGLDFNGINSQKDVAAMLRVNPTRELALIGSVYIGQWAPGGKGTYAVRNRWSGGFMFDNQKWFLRGEYIGGVTGALQGVDGRLHTDGAYLTGGVWFCNRKVAPIARVEYYTPNVELRDRTDIFYTAGLLYCPWKYVRIQANYTAKTYIYDNRSGNQLLIMLTGMF